MEKSKVYYTDFHTRKLGEGLPTKLQLLAKKAGIADLDLDGKFVAIKMHFGELGNIAYLRPNYARAIVDVVKELGGKPFLTDCNTMYPGSRKNALEHLECAWQNGFTPLTVGCPILIGDGLKGTDDVEVPVAGAQYCPTAKIGRAIMDADVFISLNTLKVMNRLDLVEPLKILVWDVVRVPVKKNNTVRELRMLMKNYVVAVNNVLKNVQIMDWNMMKQHIRCISMKQIVLDVAVV